MGYAPSSEMAAVHNQVWTRWSELQCRLEPFPTFFKKKVLKTESAGQAVCAPSKPISAYSVSTRRQDIPKSYEGV